MSSVPQPSAFSAADYLAGETTSPVKHEYIAGEVFAMAGAGEAHVTIAGNLFALLRGHVRGGPCRVYISDMKLWVESETRSVDVFRRGADGHWILFPFAGDEPVELESIGLRCPMAAIYEDVGLAAGGA